MYYILLICISCNWLVSISSQNITINDLKRIQLKLLDNPILHKQFEILAENRDDKFHDQIENLPIMTIGMRLSHISFGNMIGNYFEVS